MPTINGQRVLANSPQAIAAQNARGGIDKVSNRERMGDVAGGTTGTTAAPELRSQRLTSMGISPTLAAPKLNVDIPNVIPSTALSGGQTLEDLYTQRDNLQASADVQKGINEQITGLQGRIGAKASPIYANTDEMINRLLLNRVPTSTEQARNTLASTASQNRRDYTTEFSTAREQLGQAYNLPTLQENLGKTREQYAAREVKMNEDLKRVEENALYRGVDRAFAEAEKNKIKSQALEDLANLATIEKAQAGNVAEAKDDINTIIDDKKEAFKLENDAIQADIDYLNTLVGEDNQRQAQQLQFALNERKAAQEKILADEKEIKGYMADAAANGADQGTIQAIMNATSPEEALRFAAPFIGKLDREAQAANLANIYNQIDSRNLNDTIKLAESGDQNAINKLGFDPRSTTGNFEAESNLRKEFNGLQTVKDATAVRNSFQNINAAYSEALNAGTNKQSIAAADQALIISFNKMLDPTSVVREGEFARSTEGQSLIAQLEGRVQQALQGGVGLTDENRAQIVNLTRVLYADYIKLHNDEAFQYRQNAVRQGGDPNFVASYIDTIGLTAQNAQEGDIIIKGGQPYQKQGDQMVPLDI